jgi:hypothetical protein
MSALLFSRDATFRTETPVLRQTILQALVSLLPALSSSPGELESVKAMILEIWNGGSGLLSEESIEQEFGIPFSSSDTEHDVREALAIESVLRCMAYGPLKTRAWVLHNLVEVSSLSRSSATPVNNQHRNAGPCHLRQKLCQLFRQKHNHERFVPSLMPPISCWKVTVWIIVPPC